MALLPDITAYYDGGDEAGRLTSGRTVGTIELMRTQEILRVHLPPPPASVLDVGGGPGVHARLLADRGYRVLVIDPVERHVRQARALGLAAEVGDARSLDRADRSFDAVLLLGPLYHLPEAADRDRAWQEAARVVRPGGPVAAAVLNRYAKLLDPHSEVAPDIAATGLRVRRDGPTTYYHDPSELPAEAHRAGLEVVSLHGLHGPAFEGLRAEERRTGTTDLGGRALESALAAARFADTRPELLVLSLHLLAVARRPRAVARPNG
ncbi:Methyltransferase domain-containing protein [Streptomyces sp. TLI_053]|uniref:class I SAM-dependent methyltransferase n=1 Tax=Streptomyces sp. TLI_053 TaxID=1855352 RepID=UPI00087AF9F0|nr:class I SAM-dependent methyltransferase [Streptomyces sp. TLI_053]SDT82980.1 Methyltransferase domain-containing protein [Streptomyces sp. TLI_053]